MSDTKDCNSCASKCKKDSPCGFFTERKQSIAKIAEEILGRRWRLVQDDMREAEEDERRHQEDMEAMWRDQQHEPPEGYHDEVGIHTSIHIDTDRTNLRVRGEDGNDREE